MSQMINAGPSLTPESNPEKSTPSSKNKKHKRRLHLTYEQEYWAGGLFGATSAFVGVLPTITNLTENVYLSTDLFLAGLVSGWLSLVHLRNKLVAMPLAGLCLGLLVDGEPAVASFFEGLNKASVVRVGLNALSTSQKNGTPATMSSNMKLADAASSLVKRVVGNSLQSDRLQEHPLLKEPRAEIAKPTLRVSTSLLRRPGSRTLTAAPIAGDGQPVLFSADLVLPVQKFLLVRNEYRPI